MIKVCFVGSGNIFSKHHIALKRKKVRNFFKIIGIAEKKRIKNIYNSNIKIYSNYIKMVKDLKPDLIVIITESGNHYKHFIDLSKYCKNFLIEKPICLNSHQIKVIKRFQKKNKNNIFIVKQNRFNKSVKFLKKILQNKYLGKLFYYDVSVKWRRDNKYYKNSYWHGTKKLDGNILANQGSHHLDLVISIFGRPKKIQYVSKKVKKFIEFSDVVSLNLQHKNAIGNIRITTSTEPEDLEGKLTIMGTKGFIRIGGFQMNQIEKIKVKNKSFSKKIIKKNSENLSDVYGRNHSEVYYFIKKYLGNTQDKKIKKIAKEYVDDAFETVKVFEKIKR